MELIAGNKIANEIYKSFPERLGRLGFKPVLADIIVGDDPVALSYVNIKNRMAEKKGLAFHTEQMPAGTTTAEVQEAIKRVQASPNVFGLIVQLPLPEHINQSQALTSIDPKVDVDCIGPKMSDLFYHGQSPWLPPTAGAILAMLESLPFDYKGMKIAVVGQGELVGRPITYLLEEAGCEVVTATKADRDLEPIISDAGIVISGTGNAGLIVGDMLKPGAVVIDAGTSESGGGIVGDVDRDSVEKIAGMLSPVPGGVGPVTVAKLLENVLISAESRG